MKNIINLIVSQIENGQRVDLFIKNNKKDLSRTRIKNLILKNKLKINTEIIKDPSKKVLVGDNISLEIPEPKKASLKPYDFKLDIIYYISSILLALLASILYDSFKDLTISKFDILFTKNIKSLGLNPFFNQCLTDISIK